jgi:REP element-mobilizing transposase RayT
MRLGRIKVSPEEGPAAYHCMTRVVAGERLIDDPAKEILRRQLWLVSEFCGVEILTYAILTNHFHILVRKNRPVPNPIKSRSQKETKGTRTMTEA